MSQGQALRPQAQILPGATLALNKLDKSSHHLILDPIKMCTMHEQLRTVKTMVLNEHCASGGSWGGVGGWSDLEIGQWLWCGEHQLPQRAEPGLVDGDTLERYMWWIWWWD